MSKRNPKPGKPHIYRYCGHWYARRDPSAWAYGESKWFPAHQWCRAKNQENSDG